MPVVMDYFRNGKRFRATASFIADTGVKDNGESFLRN